eukprot:CAMPEP_0184496232 /NCGR_PEP_ID=MMETSP0113_2-20130426/33401_1 /TAXON_ID=91329 /ORGANISM="Norrisiella sphaerica, Strain BC52" /LENGTH=131 /DNA_ID=CAMNT_0026882761 /DNA_START=9 /DNA_END=404 /DNA_ORIENTATION=-
MPAAGHFEFLTDLTDLEKNLCDKGRVPDISVKEVTATALALWADSTLYHQTPGWNLGRHAILSQDKIDALHKELWPVMQKVASVVPNGRNSFNTNHLRRNNEDKRKNKSPGAVLAELAMVNSKGISYKKSL